jgi:hypothetical protein
MHELALQQRRNRIAAAEGKITRAEKHPRQY